jgi:thiamine-phosphate pyrophosphorylase
MPDLDRRAALARARLYFICDARPGGRPLEHVLVPALRGGVDVFQLRIKDPQTDDAILAAAEIARGACDEHDALFILNDRPDLVGATHADGTHVGQDDLPLDAARALIGPDAILGQSTHTPAQIHASVGADYIGVGPLNATPTKPGRAPVGLQLVEHAAAHAHVPFFAIGGIDFTNIGQVLAAGATRVAVVRAIAEAPDPEQAARQLKEAMRVGAGQL